MDMSPRCPYMDQSDSFSLPVWIVHQLKRRDDYFRVSHLSSSTDHLPCWLECLHWSVWEAGLPFDQQGSSCRVAKADPSYYERMGWQWSLEEDFPRRSLQISGWLSCAILQLDSPQALQRRRYSTADITHDLQFSNSQIYCQRQNDWSTKVSDGPQLIFCQISCQYFAKGLLNIQPNFESNFFTNSSAKVFTNYLAKHFVKHLAKYLAKRTAKCSIKHSYKKLIQMSENENRE